MMGSDLVDTGLVDVELVDIGLVDIGLVDIGLVDIGLVDVDHVGVGLGGIGLGGIGLGDIGLGVVDTLGSGNLNLGTSRPGSVDRSGMLVASHKRLTQTYSDPHIQQMTPARKLRMDLVSENTFRVCAAMRLVCCVDLVQKCNSLHVHW
jgi:hypothetical protein